MATQNEIIEKTNHVREKIRAKYYSSSTTQTLLTPATLKSYNRIYAKYLLMRDTMHQQGKFNTSTSKSSGQLYRSAIRYHSRLKLENSSTVDELRKIVDDIRFADSLKTVMKDKSKNDLKLRLKKVEHKFPDWRDRMDAHMLGSPIYKMEERKNPHRSKFADMYIIQRLSGCRSEELFLGVRVEASDVEGEYLLHIQTAKGRADNSLTNRTRIIKSNSELLEDLVGKTVKLNNIDSYRKCFESASRSEFEISLSPYSLRYSIMADLKAAGVPSHARAEFLGHENTDTQGRYSNGLGKSCAREKTTSTVKKARVKVEQHQLPHQFISNQDKL